jgi:hypothetical protein
MGKASEIWKEIKPKIGEMLAAVNDVETRAEKAQEEAYQRGLSDAWECIDKIFDMPCLKREQIFSKCDSVGVWDILRKYSASEAIEKIRQYEQEKRFHVGDEIETQNGFKGFVIREDDKYVYFVDEKGEGCVETMMAAKTGRHFPEIAEVMQKMKEEE